MPKNRTKSIVILNNTENVSFDSTDSYANFIGTKPTHFKFSYIAEHGTNMVVSLCYATIGHTRYFGGVH